MNKDWFFSWPQQALLAVAEHFLANVTGIDDFRQDCDAANKIE